MGNLSAAQITTLTADQALALQPAQATMFKTFASFTTGAVAGLDAMANLDPKFVAAIPATKFASLSTGQLAQLTGDQVAALNSAQVAALTADKITNGIGSDIAYLTTAAMAGLSKSNWVLWF
jgi:hypothetical protein